jgi:ribosomal protein L44E
VLRSSGINFIYWRLNESVVRGDGTIFAPARPVSIRTNMNGEASMARFDPNKFKRELRAGQRRAEAEHKRRVDAYNRQVDQHNKKAISDYNREIARVNRENQRRIDEHNRGVDQHNRKVIAEYNRDVVRGKQRLLCMELPDSNRRPPGAIQHLRPRHPSCHGSSLRRQLRRRGLAYPRTNMTTLRTVHRSAA